MKVYDFNVPIRKQVRMIVHTDCKNEADDQYALVHHLMTPKLQIKGILAGHFEYMARKDLKGQTMLASMDEIKKILALMDKSDEYPVLAGSPRPLPDKYTPIQSPAVDFIISEAMKDDHTPLFIGLLGTLTDLASALLIKPSIADKMTAIWIGGEDYPKGGAEFNLMQDIHAANIVMDSSLPLWQVPRSTYKQMTVSLSELQHRVKPCGAIGRYLAEQLFAHNDFCADSPDFPHGETWVLGDQPTVSLLLENPAVSHYELIPAPGIGADGTYIPVPQNRKIRVYHTVDVRLAMEDFYAKLALNYSN